MNQIPSYRIANPYSSLIKHNSSKFPIEQKMSLSATSNQDSIFFGNNKHHTYRYYNMQDRKGRVVIIITSPDKKEVSYLIESKPSHFISKDGGPNPYKDEGLEAFRLYHLQTTKLAGVVFRKSGTLCSYCLDKGRPTPLQPELS